MKYIISLLPILFCFKPSFAQIDGLRQNFNKVIPSSPQASAIMTYQNYPVDYKTGAPQVGIPLFDVKTKMGNIPFALSYHIGRLKDNELTGPVGFGWTLTPNLGISRSVNGRPDELNTGYNGPNPSFGNSSNCMYLTSLAQGQYDEEPDDFYYSLLNSSGAFMHKRGGGFTTYPFAPIRINRPSNTAFEITDIDGTLYKFGKYSTGTTTAIETTRADSYFSPDVVKTIAWKLTEIISYDKTDTIRFNYTSSANIWDVPYYNYQYRIIEYPNRPDLQPKIYKSVFNTNYSTSCMPYNSGWQAMKPYGGGQAWPNSTNWFEVFDMLPYSGGGSGIFTHVTPANNCYGAIQNPTNCFWDTYAVIENEPYCWMEYNGSGGYVARCMNLLKQKNYTSYVCETGHPASNDFGSDYQDDDLLQINKVDEVLLTSVVFRGGKVTLSYDSARIKQITLYAEQNGTYSIIKDFTLHQTALPFANLQPRVYTQYSNYRFLLDSVRLRDKSSNVISAYRMAYTKPSGAFPIAGNFSSDFWGYPDIWQGEDQVPRIDYTIDNYYWQVNSNGAFITTPNTILLGNKKLWQYDQAHPRPITVPLITRLQFATGGYAEFDFERNRYKSSANDSIYEGGGFRIRGIRYKSNLGADSIVKSYRYGENESGTGLIGIQPERSDFIYQQTVNSTNPSDLSNIVQKITTVKSSPFTGILFEGGAAVLYPEVAEYTGKPGNSIGKTIYKYNITGINPSRQPYSPLQQYYRDSWRGNNLKYVEYYQSTGSTYDLVRKESYGYTEFIKDTLRTGGAYLKYFSQAGNDPYTNCQTQYLTDVVNYVGYDIYTGDQKISEYKDTYYINGSTLESKKTYTYYPSTLFSSQETLVTSKQENKTSTTWYSDNTTELTGWPAAQLTLLNNMRTANRINTVVKVQVALNNAPQQTISHHFATFNSNIYPAETFAHYLNNADESYLKYLQYDNTGNVTSVQQTNNVLSGYLWDYKGTLPVAQITGGNIQEVAFTSFEAEDQGTWSGVNAANILTNANTITGKRCYQSSSINIFKTGLQSSETYIVSYWSKNGQMVVTGTQSGWPKSISTIDINGDVWTLYQHQVTGSVAVTVSGNGAIDELRLYPAKAELKTYTYAPLIGITTESDTNSRILYYEYDAFNRLRLIRDQNNKIIKQYDYQYQVPPTQ